MSSTTDDEVSSIWVANSSIGYLKTIAFESRVDAARYLDESEAVTSAVPIEFVPAGEDPKFTEFDDQLTSGPTSKLDMTVPVMDDGDTTDE